MDRIVPQVGEQWRTDEIYMMIKGNRRYLFAMMDAKKRFWLAQMVAEHKGNDDVGPLFEKAKEVGGKVPTKLISDGADNFHNAWKKQYPRQELSAQGDGPRASRPHGKGHEQQPDGVL